MKNKIFLIVFSTLFIALFFGVFYLQISKPKTAFVNVNELYNEFEFKKELENRFTQIEKQRSIDLDSLELELKLIDKKLQSIGGKDGNLIEIFETKREAYLLKKQQFEEDNQQMRQIYTNDINKQLNQFVEDYGKENGYTYIFGAEGSGAMMYADKRNDITNELKEYVNLKYKGKISK